MFLRNLFVFLIFKIKIFIMKKVLLILCLFVGGITFAQYAGQAVSGTSTAAGSNSSASSAMAVGQFLGPMSEANSKRTKNILAGAKGSPYASNKFAPTTLYYDGEKVGNLYYRYNALNEEIEIKKSVIEEGNSALINDKKMVLLVNGNKMSFNTFITSDKRTTNGYLSKLIEGQTYDLYKRITVKFTEGVPAQNSFIAAVPAKFSQFTEYYSQKKGVNRIDQVVTKNSKLLKMLDADLKVKTKTFLKENNLNIKNEADLIKAFEFLNK